MLENRPIVVITIGYIIGILVGLYCRISIVLLYALIFTMYQIIKMPIKKEFKLISYKRYTRYVKIIFTKKVLIIILISSIISYTTINIKNMQYNHFYKAFNNKEVSANLKIVSNIKQKKYKNIYKAKFNNKLVYLYTSKKIELKYGDRIKVTGIFNKPLNQRNYGGFDQSNFFKTLGIYGTINAEDVKKIGTSSNYFNNIFLNFREKFETNFESDISSVLMGVILGYTDKIENDVKKDFSNSSISHVLAVSGMHIGYIVLMCTLLKKITGSRTTNFITIVILIMYICIIGFHASAIRAVVMSILAIVAKLIYRKSDVWTNLSLSLLVLLLYNPFLIIDAGVQLSYMGTIGIYIFMKTFKINNKILNIFFITISVNIAILPIVAISFNHIPVLSLILSSFIGVTIIPIFILGVIFLISPIEPIRCILNFFASLLLKVAQFGTQIPFNKITVTTPSLLQMLIYYIIIFIFLIYYKIYNAKKKTATIVRFRNLISLFIHKYRQKVISIFLIIVVLISIFKIIPKELIIHFIDVGQGDSCLIITPHGKKIIIDGGGKEDYDVGKNILIPYLLDRGIKNLDYIVISHFDTDHVGGLLTVMEELKVDTVIISKQGEDSENYRKFGEMVKKKKIKVQVVRQGDRLKIENDVYFDILWPNNENLISENSLNNNSIVCKMCYKDFSILFTGDIEKIAEEHILKEYKNNLQILKSNVLKVAHHRI